MPFDNRGPDGMPSISPSTTKSVMPFNNVPTIQGLLNGDEKIGDYYPHAGGEWSPGKDVSKSYRETGDDYKREARDMDIINGLMEQGESMKEEWKVTVGNNGMGGSLYFPSFPSAQQYVRQNKIPLNYISRVANINKEAQTQGQNRSIVILDSMRKTFMVESINILEGVKETGSAFCIKKNQFITCAHVIKHYDKNKELDDHLFFKDINVNLTQDGNYHRAEVISVDLAKDIAILSCQTIDVEPFELDNDVQIGEDIFAIGSPHGYENNVSMGTVGSLDRKIFDYEGSPEYMFINLSVFSGNSGGPIIRISNGRVVGMVTMIIHGGVDNYGLNAGLPSRYIE